MAAAKKAVVFCEYFNMGQGKCKCPGYVENPSKWSKGKCKRCTHEKKLHNDADGNQAADEKPKEKNENDANYDDQAQGGGDYNDNQQEEEQQQGGYDDAEQQGGDDEQPQDEDGAAEEEQ